MMEQLHKYVAISTDSPMGLVWIARPHLGKGGYVEVGAPAFTARCSDGYYRGQLNKQQICAHVAVFYLTHGYRPSIVDHIDGNPSNNHPDNLRPANYSTNAHNSICKGYDLHKCGKYRVRIAVDGKRKHIGLFDTEQEARAAYLAAKAELHPTAPQRCFNK